jgi:hypothetical protein
MISLRLEVYRWSSSIWRSMKQYPPKQKIANQDEVKFNRLAFGRKEPITNVKILMTNPNDQYPKKNPDDSQRYLAKELIRFKALNLRFWHLGFDIDLTFGF